MAWLPINSCRSPAVVLQHAAEPFASFDLIINGIDSVLRYDELISESLIISLGVEILNVIRNGVLE